MNDNCPLCKAVREEDVFFWHGEDRSEIFAILPTSNQKGHSSRWMICSNTHVSTIKNITDARLQLISVMLSEHKDFTIMSPTHASFPEHWHLVACTLDEGEDQQQIADTDRIEIRFRHRMSHDSD